MKRKTNPIYLGKQYLPSSSQSLETNQMLLCLQGQAWNFPLTTLRVFLGGQSSTSAGHMSEGLWAPAVTMASSSVKLQCPEVSMEHCLYPA